MKRVLAICMLVCILASSLPALAAAQGGLMKVVNCEEWVSLRETPSKKADRLVRVPKNGVVVYLGNAQNGFSYVKYDNKYGYILNEYLADQGEVLRIGNCNEWVSLRAYASSSAKRLTKIPKDTMVRFLSTAYDGYFWVEYNGQKGYVASEYLMGTVESYGVTRRVVNCNEWISLRSEPSTKASRLAKIPLNATVSSLYVVDDMEYVYYNGQYGYVLSKYLANVLTFGW